MALMRDHNIGFYGAMREIIVVLSKKSALILSSPLCLQKFKYTLKSDSKIFDTRSNMCFVVLDYKRYHIYLVIRQGYFPCKT